MQSCQCQHTRDVSVDSSRGPLCGSDGRCGWGRPGHNGTYIQRWTTRLQSIACLLVACWFTATPRLPVQCTTHLASIGYDSYDVMSVGSRSPVNESSLALQGAKTHHMHNSPNS